VGQAVQLVAEAVQSLNFRAQAPQIVQRRPYKSYEKMRNRSQNGVRKTPLCLTRSEDRRTLRVG
jgi:hypothetical protein